MKKTISHLILYLLPFWAYSEHLTITNASGSVFSFNVDSEIPLKDMLASIQQYEILSNDVQIKMTIAGGQIKAVTKPYIKGQKRDYYAKLTQQEQDDVAYIIKTLANQPLLTIGTSHQGSLEKAGDRIEKIHPLNFLQFIFSNDELIVAMRNLKGRSWVWKKFLTGTVDSFKDEYAVGNIHQDHVNDFASKINVDAKQIHSIIQKQDWDNLVITLISIVPRKGDPKRYDM